VTAITETEHVLEGGNLSGRTCFENVVDIVDNTFEIGAAVLRKTFDDWGELSRVSKGCLECVGRLYVIIEIIHRLYDSRAGSVGIEGTGGNTGSPCSKGTRVRTSRQKPRSFRCSTCPPLVEGKLCIACWRECQC
jgi:hypothetical protein